MPSFPRSLLFAGILSLVTAAPGFAQVTSDQDFAARCSAPGVTRCVAFDNPSELVGTYGDNSGSFSGASTPAIDSSVRASGGGSLVFTIPPNSGADTSGSYFTNFSADLLTQFGASADLYVQWRQRFSSEFLNANYSGGEGWKQVIIGTGDKPGCVSSNSASGLCYASCTDLEVVSVNSYQAGFVRMYNSCSGSTSHGAYDPFELPFGTYDFKLQNARPSPYCLYSQGSTQPPSFFPPTGNCFGYFPNEWMTFQVHIQTGPRVNDEWVGSHVQLWVAREGLPSELVFDWGPYNLTAGSATEDQKFGKVWLLPYNTRKDPTATYPVAYTWYDELIVSSQPIADPMGVIPPQPDAGPGPDSGQPDSGATVPPDAGTTIPGDASSADASGPGVDASALADAGTSGAPDSGASSASDSGSSSATDGGVAPMVASCGCGGRGLPSIPAWAGVALALFAARARRRSPLEAPHPERKSP